ncbi:hypothetical protein [Lacisediminihabitans profunda]|uniref:Uncharacterized protein n=1 Tax=Lacisediminihabitans profunda TaxID=2594790 RepID=A0A5C8UQC6_9MICO|nr:hypothetical protein [Lacisediminihabitans profunda]TXN29770.1 hypothetical protein FVP33_11515 [Lacisediminihabitans profunda]
MGTGTEDEEDWRPIWPTAEGSDDPAEGWRTPWPPMANTALRAVSEIIEQLALNDRHPNTPFLAGTAAFWLIAIHEGRRDRNPRYDKSRLANPDGRVLDGLTLARNAVAHGQVIVSRSEGLKWPLQFPMDFGPWVWAPSREWPWRPRPSRFLERQQESYAEHFAGKLVAGPLKQALVCLGRGHESTSSRKV